jgi:hypothetical protein
MKKYLLLTTMLLGGSLLYSSSSSVTAKTVMYFDTFTQPLSTDQKMIISQDLSTITFPSFQDSMRFNFRSWTNKSDKKLIFYRDPSQKNTYKTTSKMYGSPAIASFNNVNAFIITGRLNRGEVAMTIHVTPNFSPALKNKIKTMINSK